MAKNKISRQIFSLTLAAFTFLGVLKGQTKQIFLSPPFDKLIIGHTTLKQAEKTLGEPTEKRVPEIIEHSCEKQIMLIYNDPKVLLRFGYKSKTLFNITLDSAFPLPINNAIKVSISDTNLIVKTFGTPKNIYRKPTYPYFYYKLNPWDVYFSFDDRGILHEACFFQHNNSDTGAVIQEDTTKTIFGVWVRHNQKGVKNITVNLISGTDTVSIKTNKEGFADTLISNRTPYPKLTIRDNDYEYFEVQITDIYLNQDNFVYKRIDLTEKKKE